MLKNKKYLELINHYIDKYGLNLEGYHVLVPVIEREPYLMGVIAGAAGANNIYVFDPKINLNEKIETELGFNITKLGSLPYEVTPNLNIVLKNSSISLKDEKAYCLPVKNFAISLFPDNMDFLSPQDTEIKALKERKIPILKHNTDEQRIDLYQQFAHIIVKRCYNLGLDVFRSKILLVGHGTFLNATLALLKSLGAMVYVSNTGLPFDQTYVLKHLKEIDAVIAMDYPKQNIQIIGSQGVVDIGDIVDLNPTLKVLHVCGEIETGSLKMGGISYYPGEINQESLNLNINELGERGIVELGVNCLKMAENYLKLNQ